MDEQTTTPNENTNNQAEIDPWAAAFSAFNQREQGNTGSNATTGTTDTDREQETNGSNAETNDGQVPVEAGSTDSSGNEGDAGGLDTSSGTDSLEGEASDNDLLGVSEEELEQYRTGFMEDVHDQTIRDVAAEFIKRGIRHRNGILGASVDDEDICKRDNDGVPHFYNPDTGREFSGDNPRRQAQEWVDDYNRELAGVFNKACENYESELLKTSQPQIDVLEFAGTYDSLDPVRKMMLDGFIEDYEITDKDGDVIGYSIDLKKAMAAINKQVTVIQEYGRAHAPSNTEANAPSGPALDMKSSATSVAKTNERPQFKSLAEAMEWEQDRILASMRKEN